MRQKEGAQTRSDRFTAIVAVVVAIAGVLISVLTLLEIHIDAVMSTRAWVVVAATSFSYFSDSSGVERAGAIFDIENTGNSSATQVSIWKCAKVRADEPHANELTNVFMSSDQDCTHAFIGVMGKSVPVKLMVSDRTSVVPKNSLPSMPEAGSHFYTWGRITYYTNEKEYFTSFCLVNAKDQLGPCSQGNDGN